MDFVGFAFWPHQKTGFEASERNRDASHASTAHKLILDAPRTIRMAAVLALAFPNWFLETKTERGWEEREKRKRRKEGRERRKGEAAPANSPPSWPECSACQKSSALWLSATRGTGSFLFASHDLLRRRGIFCICSCSQVQQNAYKIPFKAGRWRNLPILN